MSYIKSILIAIKLHLILLNTWLFDLLWIGSKMTVKTREIRQKEPKGERTFGADCRMKHENQHDIEFDQQNYY